MPENKLRATLRALPYLLPALIVLTVFRLYPIIRSFLMSFYTKYDYFTDQVYRYGFNNYLFIFRDSEFWSSLFHTMLFVLGVVPLSILLSLFFAVLLDQKIRFRAIFRTVYFLPFVTSVVAISIVWRWMFHSQYGLINYVLGLAGISPVKWLTDPAFAIPSLAILAIWKGLGYNIIIFLAGLQNIDKRYYLAARIDGASVWQRFKRLTVPLLSSTTLFVSIMAVIAAFKVFDEVFALFGGSIGPAGSAETMVFYIYSKFYGDWNFGVASAAAYVLFLIIFLFTLLQLHLGNGKLPWNRKKYAAEVKQNG